MSEESLNSIIIDINSKLGCLPCTPSNPSIYRVDSHLRSGGWNNVYDPEIISVGPYHHGISRLQSMQQHKYRYLKQLLKRRNEQSVERYVVAVAGMEARARKCYAEPIQLDENAFVTVMVLDGIFLIELFRCAVHEELRQWDDPIFKHERILSQLRHDIVLLENQLPFFVLNQLFQMTTQTSINSDEDLIVLVLHFVDGMFLDLSVSEFLQKSSPLIHNINHLCGLVHHAWCLQFADPISDRFITSKSNNEIQNWENINSVTGLRVAGIKFRRATGKNNLMDIKFVNGVLRMPQLSIFDETESQFRNLIAYEQYLPDGERRYVSDYTFFMHCLINTSNDVELLRSRGIIENWLGDDEQACLMFHRLGKNVLTSSNFTYSHVFCSVNKHCRRRANKWKANLCRNYFNSPWSILSFLAAIALLLLTSTQTVYSVLAFYKTKR